MMGQFSLYNPTAVSPKKIGHPAEINLQVFDSLVMPSLTLGIPIKNEEANIQTFISSLKTAISKIFLTHPKYEIEVIFCFNGTTDRSKELAEKILKKELIPNVRLIESATGKMNAMCQIARVRKFNNWIGFIDADTKVEENCLLNLIETLQNNRELFLIYAQVNPVFIGNKNVLHKIQNIHYELRNYISPRKHFHGRAFIMRSDCFLKEELRVSENNSQWVLKQGPLVDDIYLSRVIIHNYGQNSIKQDNKAVVQFLPPRSLKDFYFGQRRVFFEIKRLNLLYPEHAYLQSRYFKKRIKWGHLRKVGLRSFFSYVAYYVLDEAIRFLVRMEMLLISTKFLRCYKIWKTLKTTKITAL